LEEEAGVKGRAKYAIYEDASAESELWRVHAIVRQGSSRRMPPPGLSATNGCMQFPKSWRGLKGSDLIEMCGIPDSASVSVDGCTATCRSKESAVALAEMSVASLKNDYMQVRAYLSEADTETFSSEDLDEWMDVEMNVD